MTGRRSCVFFRCLPAAAVAALCVVWLALSAAATASAASGDDSRSSLTDVFLPSSVARGRVAVPPTGLQIAVHNALSVAVNGREYTEDGDEAQPSLHVPLQRQRQQSGLLAPQPLPAARAASDSYIGGSGSGSGTESDSGTRINTLEEANNRASESDDEIWRLVLLTVAASLASQPPAVPPPVAVASYPPHAGVRADSDAAASIPLTLVDEHGHVITRGVFHSNPQPVSDAQPAAVSPPGRGALDELLDDITARLAQRTAVRLRRSGADSGPVTADNVSANTAPSAAGVDIALTDNAGRVVGVGTYYPHSLSQQELLELGRQQPPQQQQQTLHRQRPDASQSPATGPSSQKPQRPSGNGGSGSIAVPQCYDNVYDSVYCRPTQHSDKRAVTRRHLIDTQLLPATAPVYTTDAEAAIERSRMPLPYQPRMVVVEPQRTIHYGKSDITQSLATSLAVFPPVAPFMARPRSAAVEIERQQAAAAPLEAAEAVAPAVAAGEEEGLGGVGVGAAAVGPAAEALGTEFRDQA